MSGIKQPILKTERAKEHLEALDSAINAFVKSEPCSASTYDDFERGYYVLVLKTDSPPLSLAMIAGDFLNCLRSALDWTAWQLSLTSCIPPQLPSTQVRFPIIGVFDSATPGKIRRATVGFPAEAVAIVESLQPYHHRDSYKLTHLWRLEKLWNIDKHRHLSLHSGQVDIKFPGFRPTSCRDENIGDDYVMRFPLSDKPKMGLKPVATVEVYFGDDAEGIKLTISDLRDIYEFVANKVIPRFAGFLSHSDVPRDRIIL